MDLRCCWVENSGAASQIKSSQLTVGLAVGKRRQVRFGVVNCRLHNELLTLACNQPHPVELRTLWKFFPDSASRQRYEYMKMSSVWTLAASSTLFTTKKGPFWVLKKGNF